MKNSPLFLVIFLLVIVNFCGCTQTISENRTETATDTILPSLTTITMATPPPATISVPPKDPIIGSWISYKYLASGKIELFWTFSENNTWTLVNTNVKSQHKKFVHGTWSKTGIDTYQISTSGSPTTFTYDRTNDEFTDTFFQVNYSRITEAPAPHEHVQTMNMTLNVAQIVPEMNGIHPFSGHKFLIVNISIKNTNETGWYSFDDNHIQVLTDEGYLAGSMNQKNAGNLESPFPPGKILIGEERQGNVLFGVPVSSQSYTLKLLDGGGDVVSNIITLDNVQTTATPSMNTT